MIEKKLLIFVSFIAVIVILYFNHEFGFVNFYDYVTIKNYNQTSYQKSNYCHSINSAVNTTTFPRSSTRISLSLSDESNLKVLKYNLIKHNFKHTFLRINGKAIKIYIYDNVDRISHNLIHDGIWEGGWLHQLLKYMKLYPKVQLLDFGCNMGVYTLTVAAHGYKVLAVDANSNNTDRLIQSVIENNFQKNVVVVLNGLSDVKKEFSMSVNNENIGGQSLIKDKSDSYKVKSIFIDELLPLVNKNHKVVIKMDIEGSEIKAMKMAAALFTKRNVVALCIEWLSIRMHLDVNTLIDFLIKRNFRPYKDFFSIIELDISKHQLWPSEVVWRKLS